MTMKNAGKLNARSLGVNIDHVATLRQARGTAYPDPVVAALLAEYAGASSIVAHLRQDRRHVQERDVFLLKQAIAVSLNLEMSVSPGVVACALKLLPQRATLVPERRRELTTEGGVDLLRHSRVVDRCVGALQKKSIGVSLFIDPTKKQIQASCLLGVDRIELNTGAYSEARTSIQKKKEITKLRRAIDIARVAGLFVAVGHGLDYKNIKAIAELQDIEEFNIGHAIVCRAVFTGFVAAVEEMLALISGVDANRSK